MSLPKHLNKFFVGRNFPENKNDDSNQFMYDAVFALLIFSIGYLTLGSFLTCFNGGPPYSLKGDKFVLLVKSERHF